MELSFGILDFLRLVGAIGLFIFGMKVMSDAIQKVAGNQLRNTLGAMTGNRMFAIFTGLFITGLLQSSSATTVLIVSFVNAGLVSLVESIGIIMGANIGTTVTGWLVALGIGRLSIASFGLPMVAVALPMMFFLKNRYRLIGEILLGFAILFLGLRFMNETLAGLQNEELFSFIRYFQFEQANYLGKLGILAIFVGIGIGLTLIVQSSSAAMALVLVMTYEGWISFPLAAAIILGENIGTTVTANLAALVANAHGKRAARAHFLLNLFGVIWALLAFPVFFRGVAEASQVFTGSDPMTDQKAIPVALALFHTGFNLINVAIFFFFIPFLAKVATWMVPTRSEHDEEFSLDYIGAGLMATPELSIVEARKELVKFGRLVSGAYAYIPKLITEMDERRLVSYVKKLEKHEQVSDEMELEIHRYLGQASRGELSGEASTRVQGMIAIANLLERIGDIYLQVSRSLSHRKEQKAYFTPEMRQNVLGLSHLIDKALKLMVSNLDLPDREVRLAEAKSLEKEIDETYAALRREYIQSIELGEFKLRSGMYYSDLLAEMERIADHAYNVSQIIKEPETIEEIRK